MKASAHLHRRTRLTGSALGAVGTLAARCSSPAGIGRFGVSPRERRPFARRRPVWFRPLPPGLVASDVRVQRYQGRPVLTWWQGHSIGGPGHGEGEG